MAAGGMAAGEMAGAYPVWLDIQYPDTPSRWMILIRWLLAIPHLIVLAALQFIAQFVGIWLVVGVLVTGQYPQPAFEFLVGVMRWTTQVMAYLLLLVDDYPPFALK